MQQSGEHIRPQRPRRVVLDRGPLELAIPADRLDPAYHVLRRGHGDPRAGVISPMSNPAAAQEAPGQSDPMRRPLSATLDEHHIPASRAPEGQRVDSNDIPNSEQRAHTVAADEDLLQAVYPLVVV